jgi:hypothetical protein
MYDNNLSVTVALTGSLGTTIKSTGLNIAKTPVFQPLVARFGPVGAAASGTGPTIQVVIQHSDDDVDADYKDLVTMRDSSADPTEAGFFRRRFNTNKAWVRAKVTLNNTDNVYGSPKFEIGWADTERM